MRTKIWRSRGIALVALLPLALAACGGTAATTTAPAAETTAATATTSDDATTTTVVAEEPVTLTVSNLPPATEASTREAFLAQVEAFEAKYPNITVEPSEYEWDPVTFAAQLAGGTLPTLFQIPFTDAQGLIAAGQVADITDLVAELPYADDLNPNVLAVTQDADGRIYGLATAAYGIGLHYNRSLFEQAGLDPDSPPQTWDEVREFAAAIAAETGQAGYAQMSQSNTGGWMLTSLTYAFGGRMQDGTGENITATIANEGTRQALETLAAMRWEDDSLGDNFLYDWGTINQAFAAGQIGMYMSGSDVYNSLVTENAIDPATYGLTVLPLAGGDAGVLAGGTVVAVKSTASEAEVDAAVKWLDFFYLAKLVDEAAAVADAEALVANGAPLGTPALPIFDEDQLALSDSWVAGFVNVPLDQMRFFKEGILSQPLVPEPAAHAQEMYAILDAVVQTVMTEEGADLDALLQDAEAQVTQLLESS